MVLYKLIYGVFKHGLQSCDSQPGVATCTPEGVWKDCRLAQLIRRTIEIMIWSEKYIHIYYIESAKLVSKQAANR